MSFVPTPYLRAGFETNLGNFLRVFIKTAPNPDGDSWGDITGDTWGQGPTQQGPVTFGCSFHGGGDTWSPERGNRVLRGELGPGRGMMVLQLSLRVMKG